MGHPDQPPRLRPVLPSPRQVQSDSDERFEGSSQHANMPGRPTDADELGQLDEDKDGNHSQRAGNSGDNALGAQQQRGTESNAEGEGVMGDGEEDMGNGEEEDETDDGKLLRIDDQVRA